MPNFKTITHRDKQWLLEQRNQSCIFSGSDTVEVAHIRKGANAGLATKPHDYLTLPIHYELHRDQHQHGEMSFYLKMANEFPLVLMEMVRAFAKLRYLAWLVKNKRNTEAIELLGG